MNWKTRLTKIKIGDKVRFKDENSHNAKYFKSGLVNLEITHILHDTYWVDETDGSYNWSVEKDEVIKQ